MTPIRILPTGSSQRDLLTAIERALRETYTAARDGVALVASANSFEVSQSIGHNQNAQTGLQIDNGSTGTTASALIDLRNGDLGVSDRLIVGVLGTGFTAIPSWQDAAIVSAQANISGGLILGAPSGASIKFQINFTQVGAMSATAFSCPSATTGSAANVHQASSGSALLRSTSSQRYKTDIEALADAEADKVLLLEPVTYRSKALADNPNRLFWGFTAEQADEVLPVLVQYDAQGQPDSFQYERVIVGLVSVVKRLEARVAALEGA